MSHRLLPLLTVLALASLTPARPAPADELDQALARAVAPVRAGLDAPALKDRQQAARELARFGPAAVSTTDALLAGMKEESLRPDATRALIAIGPSILPRLTDALDNDDPFYRIAVLRVIWDHLAQAGPPVGLLDKLIVQLDPERPGELRVAACEVAFRLADNHPAAVAPKADALTRALLSAGFAKPEVGTQAAAARAIGAIGKPAVPAVKAALADERPLVRIGAAESAGQIGPAAGEVVPELIAWLDSDQWRLRQTAAVALGGMGPAARPAVDKLIAIAWKSEPQRGGATQREYTAEPTPAEAQEIMGPVWAHEAAVRALIRLGPVAEPAVPLLLDKLSKVRLDRRLALIETLGAIGPAAAEAIPQLLDLLTGPNSTVPSVIVSAVGQMGQAAREPAVKLLASDAPILQAVGVEILRKLGPAAAPAVNRLTPLLSSDDAQLRGYVAEALAAIGPAAAPAAGSLVKAIVASDDPQLRWQMFNALGAIGGEAVDELTGLLDHKDVSVRRDAIATLGWIGPAAAPAAPALAQQLGHADAGIRLAVPVALGRIGKPAVPAVLATLVSPDAETLKAAAESLARIGPAAAPEAIDPLVGLARYGNVRVQAAAIWALGRMGPQALGRGQVEQLLAAGVKAGDPAVRRAAIDALGQSPQPTAGRVEQIAATLSQPELRDAAVAALAAIGKTAAAD